MKPPLRIALLSATISHLMIVQAGVCVRESGTHTKSMGCRCVWCGKVAHTRNICEREQKNPRLAQLSGGTTPTQTGSLETKTPLVLF
jgi:hypothetical protein